MTDTLFNYLRLLREATLAARKRLHCGIATRVHGGLFDVVEVTYAPGGAEAIISVWARDLTLEQAIVYLDALPTCTEDMIGSADELTEYESAWEEIS